MTAFDSAPWQSKQSIVATKELKPVTRKRWVTKEQTRTDASNSNNGVHVSQMFTGLQITNGVVSIKQVYVYEAMKFCCIALPRSTFSTCVLRRPRSYAQLSLLAPFTSILKQVHTHMRTPKSKFETVLILNLTGIFWTAMTDSIQFKHLNWNTFVRSSRENYCTLHLLHVFT